jgi:ribokinase
VKRVVVVGSINLDLVAFAPSIARAGETRAGSTFQTFPGGKGANQAVAAARVGASVSMVGKVGSDAFGEQLRANLQSAGVDIEAVAVAPGPSGVALITTDQQGQNAITVIAGANALVVPADLDQNIDVIRGADVLLSQLELPLETVIYLSDIARREHIPLVLDPAPASPVPSALLNNVAWLTPNETEACSLLGDAGQQISDDDVPRFAEALLKLGSRNVILKLGDRGCFLALSDGTRERIPAYPVRAVDSTAAGDAFNGAFAAALLDGRSPIESARYASAVAAISVTRNGAQPSMPTRAEVEQFLGQELASG